MATYEDGWDADYYWKEQDFQTSARLTLQHWIWQYQLGHNLHHNIPVTSSESLRIADVACGNGAWLLDLSRSQPQHSFDGFDLTPAHLPHRGFLPSNVKLHVWDAFSPVPEEYVEAFDVVHIRTISSAIVDNKVNILLTNLLRMLKPGGYLQWDENDTSTMVAQPASDNVVSTASQQIVRLQHVLLARSKLSMNWLHDLPSLLEAQDCEVLANEIYKPRKELARAWSDNLLSVWKGVVPRLPEKAVPLPPGMGLPETLSKAGFARLMEDAAAETQNGVFIGMDQVVVLAKKAG